MLACLLSTLRALVRSLPGAAFLFSRSFNYQRMKERSCKNCDGPGGACSTLAFVLMSLKRRERAANGRTARLKPATVYSGINGQKSYGNSRNLSQKLNRRSWFSAYFCKTCYELKFLTQTLKEPRNEIFPHDLFANAVLPTHLLGTVTLFEYDFQFEGWRTVCVIVFSWKLMLRVLFTSGSDNLPYS